MSDTHFDVIVLGAGPGGYVAAERLGHAGKKVALVEEQYLGGTCLNVGCIPTKTLLNGAKNYLHAKEASQFGVDAQGVAVNWTQMQAWKDQVVKGLVAGVAATERKAGVTVINGRGHLDAPGRVTVEGTTYTSDHVIIATGSVPAMPPLPGTQDNPALVDSTGILSLPEVPSRLAIIGGGVIGVEFASLYATLGSQVTVIEMAPEILPFMDDDLAAKARAAMKDVTFELGCRVESLDGGTVHYSKGEEKLSVEADVVLMAVGRRPATEGWGAKEAGLEINRGIVVDDTMRTNLPNVWAIGDVTGRSLLAHAAYRMAEIASANILDPTAKKRGEVMRWHTVPWAVFSIPEAAGVGLTESAAKREGREVLVVKGLVAGVAATERKAGVTVINGRGHLDAPGRVTVEGTTYTSDHVIIATGSVPAMPPLPGTQDNPALVDSTGILSLPEVPSRLAIIGGGVIGVEFASLYATLGSQVTVIEMAPEILPFMDDDLAAKARAAMKDVTFELGCRVESLDGGTVHYSKGEEKLSVEADVVLMAVGRRPATEGWGAKEAGLEINRGIVVDDTMRTNLPNVWAIGDVTGRSLLAHAAYRMAEIASANILDPTAKKRGEVMRWHTVPWAVFSIPEAAGVGLTESAAKREGREVLVAKVPALMSGRFIAENGFKAPGEAKILVDPKTHQVLGIHVLGAYAAEMIWGAQAVLEMELTVEDLRQVVFPHPTVSEVIREAAWAVKL